MKVIIDIPYYAYMLLKNQIELDNVAEKIIANGKPYEEIPTGDWIPVSERLPKEEDYHKCYGLPDGCVLWQLDNGIIGFGWYYESTKAWSDTNDHKIEENGRRVIAWQPLPEPYKETEE